MNTPGITISLYFDFLHQNRDHLLCHLPCANLDQSNHAHINWVPQPDLSQGGVYDEVVLISPGPQGRKSWDSDGWGRGRRSTVPGRWGNKEGEGALPLRPTALRRSGCRSLGPPSREGSDQRRAGFREAPLRVVEDLPGDLL
eukprot:751133-Hanusia_phi.AAC.8